MFLRRHYQVIRMIQDCQQAQNLMPVSQSTLERLKEDAIQQLSITKIVNREIDYCRIELFLEVAPNASVKAFYSRLKADLQQLFSNERAKHTFEKKWTQTLKSNIMRLFSRLAFSCVKDPSSQVSSALLPLYAAILARFNHASSLTRVDEKFLEPFLIELMKEKKSLDILGTSAIQSITKTIKQLHQMVSETEPAKSMTGSDFLQYSVFCLLSLPLPHEKYLYSQLLHAPNPKFLLPFRKKGLFVALTNQILSKLSRIDLQACRFWGYFDYEDSDLYMRIRRASEWDRKFDVLILILKKKINHNLDRYISTLNEKIFRIGTDNYDDEAIRSLTSLVELCLHVCHHQKEVKKREILEPAFAKLDLESAYNFFIKDDPKLRDFLLKITELYLFLHSEVQKKNARSKMLFQTMAINLVKAVSYQQDSVFTSKITEAVVHNLASLSGVDKTSFIYFGIEQINRKWYSDQSVLLNNQIMTVSAEAINYLSTLVEKFGFEDFGNVDYKNFKLEFFFILALNDKNSSLIQGKKKLSLTNIDISNTFNYKQIFSILDTKRAAQEELQTRLSLVFGDYGDLKYQQQGLFSVIYELTTYRIQITKDIDPQSSFFKNNSIYSLFVSLLAQFQRIGMSKQAQQCLLQYLQKCNRTYMIDLGQLRYRDDSKERFRLMVSTDVCCLIEGSISANPIVSNFCHNILTKFINQFPEIGFDFTILSVFAECISILYRKNCQEYESRAELIPTAQAGFSLDNAPTIPTTNEEIMKRLGCIMSALYWLTLRGHSIDGQYLRIRISHLVKSKSKSAEMGFGWKFLKYLVGNFKESRQYVWQNVLDNHNLCWFIDQEFFTNKLNSIKPKLILLEKSVCPLHTKDFTEAELRKLFKAVEPQSEDDFIVSSQSRKTNFNELEDFLKELEKICRDPIANLTSSLEDFLTRIKVIPLHSDSLNTLLAQLLSLCSQYNHSGLLSYILAKVIPYLYSAYHLTETMVRSIGDALFKTVQDLNDSNRLNLQEEQKGENNTFDLNLNPFKGIEVYQSHENTPQLDALCHQFNTSHPANKFVLISQHRSRKQRLEIMYGELIKFLHVHMHAFIANGMPLGMIMQVMAVSFELEPQSLQQIPLESICLALNSQLELVNAMKSSVENGETAYNQAQIDSFYLKTLRMGLSHFQKRRTFYLERLLHQGESVETLNSKISFFIRICDYLSNQDFHKILRQKIRKFPNKAAKKKRNKLLQLLGNVTGKRKQHLEPERVAINQNNDIVEIPVLRTMLLYLISEQIDRLKAYCYTKLSKISNPYSLAGRTGFIRNQQVLSLYRSLGDKSALLIFNLVRIFGPRIEQRHALLSILADNLTSDQTNLHVPQFLELFIETFKHSGEILKQINFWKTPHVQVLLKYLSTKYEQYPYLQLYVTKVLSRLEPQQILFYLPQIFQALTLKHGGYIIYNFLLEYARKSCSFAHQLIWICQVEAKHEPPPHIKDPRAPQIEENLLKLREIATSLIAAVKAQFTGEQRVFFREVDGFYQSVTAVSGMMEPKMASSRKKEIIKEAVSSIEVPPSIYLPINPNFKILAIDKDSGTPMQSAAKCPFLLTFKCERYGGPDEYFEARRPKRGKQELEVDDEGNLNEDLTENTLQRLSISKVPRPQSIGSQLDTLQNEIEVQSNLGASRKEVFSGSQISEKSLQEKQSGGKGADTQDISCIFKVFDDIRQDCLALQVIDLFRQIFERHELELRLFAYRTISNRTGSGLNIGGIIEVVPNTMSRDAIGKTNEESLYEFFISNFGPQYTHSFQQARQNFIRSQAAYSIISYLLQIKDRHNGNILINREEGFLIHIDFGFIFEISPGRNMRFEKAHFKLTEEMIEIMGGKTDSEAFQFYLSLVVKGFLLARKYHQHVLNLVQLMLQSGLPCFLPPTIQNLRSRFVLHMSEFEAASYMEEVVLTAANHWTTNWYDRIQWIQQKIYH